MLENPSLDERQVREQMQRALIMLERADHSLEFDFEKAFLDAGCSPALAEVLRDYMPSACGRALARVMGMLTVETYERALPGGGWTGPRRFADDPLWPIVERFVDDLLRGTPRSVQLLILAGKLSGEFAAVNNAANAGQTLDQLKGGTVATVFMSPLRHAEKPDA